jgi:hypothetical protein
MSTSSAVPNSIAVPGNPSLGESSNPTPNVGSAPSQATALSKLAAEAELWHTADGTAYATIEMQHGREHWRLRSRAFGQWLARRHYAAHHA